MYRGILFQLSIVLGNIAIIEGRDKYFVHILSVYAHNMKLSYINLLITFTNLKKLNNPFPLFLSPIRCLSTLLSSLTVVGNS